RFLHTGHAFQRVRYTHQRDGIQIEALADVSQHKASHWIFNFSASARVAWKKQSRGARTTPAPTWPTPASLCAMPVLMTGAIPVSTTRRMSMPLGTPEKSNAGIVHC